MPQKHEGCNFKVILWNGKYFLIENSGQYITGFEEEYHLVTNCGFKATSRSDANMLCQLINLHLREVIYPMLVLIKLLSVLMNMGSMLNLILERFVMWVALPLCHLIFPVLTWTYLPLNSFTEKSHTKIHKITNLPL